MIGDIKHIVVIQSLPVGDLQSGKELYDDTIIRRIELLGNRMTHEFFNINEKEQLIEVLRYVNAKAPYVPGGVLIHLETHGSMQLDGLVLSNRELISWKELVEELRGINIGTNNKLYITMATCFGRYLYTGVDPYKKSPYSGYISASKEVLVDELIEDFSQLFDMLIAKGNLIDSFMGLDRRGSNFYYKDSKTTFEDNVIGVKWKFDHDEEFKRKFTNEVKASCAPQKVQLSDDEIEVMRMQAFNDIVRKQKEAFEFPE